MGLHSLKQKLKLPSRSKVRPFPEKNPVHDAQAPSNSASNSGVSQQNGRLPAAPSITESILKQTLSPEISTEQIVFASTLSAAPPRAPEVKNHDTPAKSLWDEAFDALEREHPDQVKAYTDLLSRKLADAEGEKAAASDQLIDGLASDDPAKRREQLRRITDLGIQRTESKRLKFTLAGRTFFLRDQALSVATFSQWANNNLKDVLTNIPYGGALWLGFVFILPLISHASEEEERNKAGFTFVTAKMRYYNKMEELLLPPALPRGVKDEMRERLVELYMNILDFQIRSILHLYRSRTDKYFRGIVRHDDWEAKRRNIENQERAIREQFNTAIAGTQLALTTRLPETLDNMRVQATQTHHVLQDALGEIAENIRLTAAKTDEIVENTNDIAEQTRDILRFHKKMEKMELSKQQQRCLHSLFVTDTCADKDRIENIKGGLIEDCSNWILSHETFESWRDNDSTCTRTFWVHGGPGKGKTMLLICIINEMEKWRVEKHDDMLLAYFFCQGADDNLNHALAVLRSLIHQLVTQENDLIEYLQETYQQNGDRMFERSSAFYTLSQIFKKMLENTDKKVCLIVDALDECESGQRNLLDLINDTPSAKWIVSSRITPDIEEQLGADEDDGGKVNLNVSSETTQAIKTYIDHKVSQLRTLKEPGLREEVRQALHEKADDTFLWVALVCQELEHARRAQRVREVLDAVPKGLYPLYERMLEKLREAKASDHDCCQLALSVSVLAKAPMHWKELQKLADIQKNCPGLDDMQNIIDMCGSFLVIRKEYVYFAHLSAKEYLLTQTAAAEIFPDGTGSVHFDLFARSLASLGDTLCRDLYKLEDPGVSISDIEAPTSNPLEAVQYAATFWVDHFCVATAEEQNAALSGDESRWTTAVSDDGLILSFFRQHFLHWTEGLSLLSRMSDMVRSIRQLLETINAVSGQNSSVCGKLRAFLVDAERFGLRFRHIMEQAPLQIYASALVFCPNNTEVKRLFWNQRMPFIASVDGVPDEWDFATHVFESNSELTLAAISPDEKSLASFDYNFELKAWDIDTGALLCRTRDFRSRPKSLAFWPDAQTLAFLCEEGVVLRDVKSGAVKNCISRPAICPWDKITQEALSPDGQTIASGMNDGQICLWESVRGRGQRMANNSLPDSEEWKSGLKCVFSPDGKTIAVSCGKSDAIYLLETASATVLRVLYTGQDEHNEHVSDNGSKYSRCREHALVFSPDGMMLAANPGRCCIMVWNTTTGTLQGTCPTKDGIRELRFSPDGLQVIFLDENSTTVNSRTVGVYDVGTSKPKYGGVVHHGGFDISPHKGIASLNTGDSLQLTTVEALAKTTEASHPERFVSGAKFSPDKSVILVGSRECLGLWDAATGEFLLDIEKTVSQAWTNGPVVFSRYPSVFSPDSTKCACTTEEPEAVFVIDLRTKNVQRFDEQDMMFHFSPDSKLLVTGCSRGTVVWDLERHAKLYDTAGMDLNVVFSPDSKLAVLRDAARPKIAKGPKTELRVLDSLTGSIISTIEREIKYCCWSTDSTLLAISPQDGTNIVEILSALSAETKQTLTSTKPVRGLTFSPDNRTLILSSSSPDELYFWNWEAKEVYLVLDVMECVPWDSHVLKWRGIMNESCGVIAKSRSDDNSSDIRHCDMMGHFNAPVIKMSQVPEEITLVPWQHFGLQVVKDWVQYDGKKILYAPPEYQNEFSQGGGSLAVLTRDLEFLTYVRFNF